MDTHHYGIYDNTQIARTWDQQISAACATRNSILGASLWVIVGEWTTAATDCASKVFNGPNAGSRYDGTYPGSTRIGSCDPYTGSGANFSAEYKTFLRKFFEAQTSSEPSPHE